MVRTRLVARTDFLGLDHATWLYTAAECPMLAAGAAALAEYAVQKSSAEAGRRRHALLAEQCKTDLARLMGVSAQELAFLSSASEGINALAGLIDFRAGDNVVVNNLEFPSVTLPWLRLRKAGVEVRVVAHRHWDITAADILAAVDARTRLVALSHVSYVNGLLYDVEAIGAALRQTQALFLLDATQSLGVIPVPVDAADFVVSSTYKWLLGTHGLGILYWNRTRQPEIEPAAIGWYSVTDLFAPDRYEQYTLRPDAGRFELGYNNFPAIYVLARSVPYLHTIGLPRIATHARALGGLLIAGLQRLHLEVITPEDPTRRGASISFLHPDAAAIGRALAQQQIHVWAGDGRVRASTHLFNDEADVGVYLAALAHILDNHPSGAQARRAPDPTHAGKRA